MASIALFPCSFINGATIIGELSNQLGLTVYTDELLFIEVAEKHGGSPEEYRTRLFGKYTDDKRIALVREKHVNMLRRFLLAKMLTESRPTLFFGRQASLFDADITSVFRVLVVDSVEERIRRAMRQEGCSSGQALAMIERHDAEMDAWTKFLHRRQAYDRRLYDSVVAYRQRDVFTVVNEVIKLYTEREAGIVGMEMSGILRDKSLALAVERVLLDAGYQIGVSAHRGVIEVLVESSSFNFPWLSEDIAGRVSAVDGVAGITVRNVGYAADSARKQPLANWLPVASWV